MTAKNNSRNPGGPNDVFTEALRRQLADLELAEAIGPDILSRLLAHWKLLQEWNTAANLTALTDPREAAIQLFADSLTGLHMLNRHVPPAGDILDIGSGGGFPGLALALCDPQRRYVLVDRNNKKTAFLRNAARELGISHRVSAMSTDITASGFPPGAWAMVTSKATFSTNQWVSWAHSFMPENGYVMLYRRLDESELRGIDSSLRIIDTYDYALRGLDNRRRITLVGRDQGATGRG